LTRSVSTLKRGLALPARTAMSEATGATSHTLFWGVAFLRNFVPSALFATLLYVITGWAGLSPYLWVALVSTTSVLVTLTLGLTILARKVVCASSRLTVIRGNSKVEMWPWDATYVTPAIRTWAALPAGVWIIRQPKAGVPPAVASIGISQWRAVHGYLAEHLDTLTGPRPGRSDA